MPAFKSVEKTVLPQSLNHTKTHEKVAYLTRILTNLKLYSVVREQKCLQHGQKLPQFLLRIKMIAAILVFHIGKNQEYKKQFSLKFIIYSSEIMKIC